MAMFPAGWLSEAEQSSLKEGLVTLASGMQVYCKSGEHGRMFREYATLVHLAKYKPCRTPAYLALFPNMLVTQYLGDSLPDLMYAQSSTLSQILDALQSVWSAGIVHCDIKPDHIVVNSEGAIGIIDFDLSQQPWAIHRKGFRGTLTFAGASALMGLDPSPATDLESLFYSVAIICSPELLPWFDFACDVASQAEFIEEVMEHMPKLLQDRADWLYHGDSDNIPVLVALRRMIDCAYSAQEPDACNKFAQAMILHFTGDMVDPKLQGSIQTYFVVRRSMQQR